MPIKPIDYSKSVIYKIQSIHDDNLLYIGSTTDFTRRKSEHKSRHKTKKTKLYEMIRGNGGWDCFNIIVVKEFPCENKTELQIEEDNMMREMKSTLNTIRPHRTNEERYEYNKQWKVTHQEQISKYLNEYRTTHKEELKKKRQERRKKIKQEAEAQQILEELWLCREREIIRNISTARDMDYDTLMAEFGSKK